MNVHYRIGAKIQHAKHGRGIVGALFGEDGLRVAFPSGQRVVFKAEVRPILDPLWADVMPGDTVEFEVQGDALKVKAQGSGTQATVLGWRITEVDGIWDLLSIKKRNPPVPVHLGAKVEYRDKIWMLIYGAMVISDHETVGNMIWVEINENEFNWVGHMDIDREKFDVIFTGWQNL